MQWNGEENEVEKSPWDEYSFMNVTSLGIDEGSHTEIFCFESQNCNSTPCQKKKKRRLVLLKHFKYCRNKQIHVCDMTASNGSPSSDTTLKRVMVDADKGLSP